MNRHDPSLANEVHPVVARHPDASFPVNHLQEAVPKSTNDRFLPPCHDPPFLRPLKTGVQLVALYSPCTPGSQIKSM